MKKALEHNKLVGPEHTEILTVPSDNEAVVKRAYDPFTNHVESVRFITRRMALCIADVFDDGKSSRIYLHLKNKVATHFNYYSKTAVFL